MKKFILVVTSIIVILRLFLIYSKSVFKSTSVENKIENETKIFADGKFGFFRDAESIDQEKIDEMGATWMRPNFGYFV